MILTNLEIFNFMNTCSKMIEKTLPLKLAYCLRYNINLLTPFYKACEEERLNIIKKYAEKDKEGNVIEINDTPKFSDNKVYEELNELFSIENEINLKKIDISIVEKADEEQFDSITMQELNMLMLIIEE